MLSVAPELYAGVAPVSGDHEDGMLSPQVTAELEPLAGTTLASPLASAITEMIVPLGITISKRSSSLSE
jgi:hypothetical protein